MQGLGSISAPAGPRPTYAKHTSAAATGRFRLSSYRVNKRLLCARAGREDVSELLRGQDAQQQMASEIQGQVAEIADVDRTGELLIWIWSSIFAKKKEQGQGTGAAAGGRASAGAKPAVTETAVFGGGCFWCLDSVFRLIRGVVEVEAGYAGGSEPRPTYRQVCTGATGHAEVVRVEYDPAQVGFSQLLDVFFAAHDPSTKDRQGNDVGPQYRSILLVSTHEQLLQAQQFLDRLSQEAQASGSAPPTTQLLMLGPEDGAPGSGGATRSSGSSSNTNTASAVSVASTAGGASTSSAGAAGGVAVAVAEEVRSTSSSISQAVLAVQAASSGAPLNTPGQYRFWAAEREHQEFFEKNPGNGYCMTVVAPKIESVRGKFQGMVVEDEE